MAALCFVCFGAWHLIVGNEPSYQGRKLHSWLQDLDAIPRDTNAPAYHAVRAMGTNAIPYLVADIVARDPGWRSGLSRRARNSRWTWFQDSPAQRSRARASRALRALGSDAAPALPLLIEEVRKADGQSGLPWVGISAILHAVPETLTTLTNELQAPVYRSQTAHFLGVHATNAEVSIPFLILCAQDEHWQTRYYALMGLERFGPQASDAAPVIEQLLSDTNAMVATKAASALETITGD